MQTPALEGIGWPPPQLRLLPSSDAFRSSKIWGPPTWFGAPRASTVSLSTYHCHQLLPPRCEVTGTMGESEVESGWCFHLAGESSIQWDVHLNIHDIHWVRDSIGVFFPMDRWSDWWFQTWILCSTIYGMSSFPLTNSYFSRWLLHHQAVMLFHFKFHWGDCSAICTSAAALLRFFLHSMTLALPEEAWRAAGLLGGSNSRSLENTSFPLENDRGLNLLWTIRQNQHGGEHLYWIIYIYI